MASDGGIFSYGDATFYGSTGAIHLNKPIVGMAATPDGERLLAGRLRRRHLQLRRRAFYGSTGAIHLNKPIVGMATTTDGSGYWLVASDGGIFSYGDAGFYGSTGAIRLTSRSSAWLRRQTATGTGSWPSTAASSPSATPGTSDRRRAGASTPTA